MGRVALKALLPALTLGTVRASKAHLAVTLAGVTEAMPAAVTRTALLAAVLRGEVFIALADAMHAHAMPVAVLGAGGVGAVDPHVGLVTHAAPVHAAPVTAASPGTGGQFTVHAFPALLTVAAAGLGEEGPMATAVAAQICQEGRNRWRSLVRDD